MPDLDARPESCRFLEQKGRNVLQTIRSSISVVITSDSFLVGDGLASLLDGTPDIVVVGRTRNLNELIGLLRDNVPRAVVIYIHSKICTTKAIVTVIRHLRKTYPDMAVVVISDRVDEFAVERLRGGSFGVAFLLGKHLPEARDVVDKLRAIKLSQTPPADPNLADSFTSYRNGAGLESLTSREVDYLDLLAHGLSNRAIADALSVSMKAVENTNTSIFLKLGPFDGGASDRRVCAALMYLSTKSDPFSADSEIEAPITADRDR
jgi:DNA-binding NarL/FixJ family response regulator